MIPPWPTSIGLIAVLETAQPSMSLVCFWLELSTVPLLIVPTDTGIYIDHPDFEGRASWGATFGGYSDTDKNGHGTHCAGTAVSEHYGVAKYAEVIAVRVLGDDGNGQNSDM